MKFKVGDKVKSLEIKDSLKYSNREGIITELDGKDFIVSFNGSDVWTYLNEKELELIEEPKGKTLEQIKKDYSYPIKDIRLDKLKQLIKAVNTLGEFGKEVELKITIELDGKKIEL